MEGRGVGAEERAGVGEQRASSSGGGSEWNLVGRGGAFLPALFERGAGRPRCLRPLLGVAVIEAC